MRLKVKRVGRAVKSMINVITLEHWPIVRLLQEHEHVD